MKELKEELEDILGGYMNILLYTEVLLGYCENNFCEPYITPIMKCLEKINELNNELYNKLDNAILKIDN